MREGWEYKKLGEVCDFQGGSQPPKNEWSKEPKENYVRMLQIRDFTQDASNYIEYVKKTKSLKYCNEDDILLGRYGASVGKILSGLSGAYNVAIIKSIPKEIVRKRYLRLYFLSTYFQKNLIVVSQHRAAQAGFSKEDIFSFQIPIPPLSEQQRLVEELDLLSSIIEKKNAQLKELDSLAQSIFYDMFGDPVTNEKGWEVKKLDRICSKITDGTHDTPARLDKGIKFITGKHIRPFFIDYDNSDYVTEEIHKEIYQRCNPEFGDVLYTNIGAGIGNAAINIVEYEFSMKNVALLKPHKGIVSGYYIEYYLNNEIIKTNIIDNYSNGGAQKFLSLKSISKIPIPLPPLPLQQQFAEKVEAIEHQKELIKQSIKEVETLFNSRMDYYFDG